jgi:folate-binding protein YgfZ
MANGTVREAFILDSRGKTLGFGHILAVDEKLLFTMPESRFAIPLIEHFKKYVIREDLRIVDRSLETVSFWVGRNDSSIREIDELRGLEPDSVRECKLAETPSVLARLELAGDCFLLSVAAIGVDRIKQYLQMKKFVERPLSELETLRIEQGTPWYGRDVDGTNLPQELRRDERAISFTKGCYLGQETVAKIDALGHVNRFLVGVAADSETQEFQVSDSILVDGKIVGTVTSASYSPWLNRFLGLGFVKRQFADVGTVIEIGLQSGRIIKLPVCSLPDTGRQDLT